MYVSFFNAADAVCRRVLRRTSTLHFPSAVSSYFFRRPSARVQHTQLHPLVASVSGNDSVRCDLLLPPLPPSKVYTSLFALLPTCSSAGVCPMHTDLSKTERTIAACAFLSFPRPKQAPKHVILLGVPLSLSLLPGGVAGVGLFEALLQLLFRVPSSVPPAECGRRANEKFLLSLQQQFSPRTFGG